MLLLSKLNCNPSGTEEKTLTHPFHQQGMVLIVVLWVMMLISLLMTHLFSSAILNTKLTSSLLTETQQFEAAEAALLQYEKQLAQLVSERPATIANAHLMQSPITYAGYHVTLNAIRLPQGFCILPMRRKGYYYQLTATAKPIHSSSIDMAIRLQTTVALPSLESCQHHFLERQAGRSAWCQLS
jgi:hypothetical protein